VSSRSVADQRVEPDRQLADAVVKRARWCATASAKQLFARRPSMRIVHARYRP